MSLFRRRTAATTTATLYGQCEQLFAASHSLVNMSSGCCDGYLGLLSPDGTITYHLTFYSGGNGYYAIWEHPETGGDTTSFMHPAGQFTQRGTLSPSLVESVIATFTPVRLDDGQ
jgi:hypothetical protein